MRPPGLRSVDGEPTMRLMRALIAHEDAMQKRLLARRCGLLERLIPEVVLLDRRRIGGLENLDRAVRLDVAAGVHDDRGATSTDALRETRGQTPLFFAIKQLAE